MVEETKAITEVTGIAAFPYAALWLAALRGREEEAREVVRTTASEVVARGEGFAMATTETASAVLYNGLGRYDIALAAARRAEGDCTQIGSPTPSMAELVEAAVRSGERQLAGRAPERLAETTRASGTEWALGIEARARALLSDGDTAEGLYREAIERLTGTRVCVELARAHLLYGEWLRRRRRRADARGELRRAHTMFATMGAEAFAGRAERALRATGERARRRTGETRDDLTPQERQIAILAQSGLSNPEIAGRLFITRRTVEYHLTKVFSKLGIRTRGELAPFWRRAADRSITERNPVRPTTPRGACANRDWGDDGERTVGLLSLPALHGPSRQDAPGGVVIDHPARRRERSQPPVRVLVAEGHALVRAAYRSMLESWGRIVVVGKAATARETTARAAEARPGVLVLDLALPGLDDLQTIAGTVGHPALAGMEVMVLAGPDDDERALGALQAGAVGLVAKDTHPRDLIRGVCALARGEAFMSADCLRRLVRELPLRSLDHTVLPEQLAELTQREGEIVALVATGLSNAEIADRLVISPATAKTHVSRAMRKLGARHRAELVVVAYEAGLVHPRSPKSPPPRAAAEVYRALPAVASGAGAAQPPQGNRDRYTPAGVRFVSPAGPAPVVATAVISDPDTRHKLSTRAAQRTEVSAQLRGCTLGDLD